MKSIIIKLLVAVVLSFAGMACSKDFLNVPLKGRLSTDLFPADQAVVGCYAVFLSGDKDWSLWEAWNNYVFGNIMSDDAYKGGNSEADQADMGVMERFETLPGNGVVKSFYLTYYHYIFIFNTTLEGLAKSKDVSDSLRNRYMGEVKFLRAYAYMRLMMAYGSKAGNLGLVLVDHPLLPNEIGKIPRADYQATWNFIISDLKYAEDHLPAKQNYAVKDLGRATKGAAQAMIARSYMFSGDWNNTELYAARVINSNSYQLETEFKDVFSKANKHGKESIFELAYTIDNYFGTGGYDYSHGAWWATSQQPSPNGWGIGALTKDLLDEFTQNPGDPRIVWTFLFNGDKDISSGTESQLTFNVGVDPDKLHLRKVWDPLHFQTGGQTDHNLIIMRYADVLLMYAEAANENGKTSEALDALKKVRKRARESSFTDPYRLVEGYNFPTAMPVASRVPDVTVTDKTQLRNAIWHERRVELAGESLRFYDLVRQGRAGVVMRAFAQKYNILKGKAFTDGKNESLPIPQEEIQASPGGIIKQNPKYN